MEWDADADLRPRGNSILSLGHICAAKYCNKWNTPKFETKATCPIGSMPTRAAPTNLPMLVSTGRSLDAD